MSIYVPCHTSAYLSSKLSRRHSIHDQTKYAEHRSVRNELNEEFERRFGNHPSYPVGYISHIYLQTVYKHTKDKSGPSSSRIGLPRGNGALYQS